VSLTAVKRIPIKDRWTNVVIALVILWNLCGTNAFAQNTPDVIDAHLIAARTAAGFDFTGTLACLCLAPVAVRSEYIAGCGAWPGAPSEYMVRRTG
jgi:hypothetical protein